MTGTLSGMKLLEGSDILEFGCIRIADQPLTKQDGKLPDTIGNALGDFESQRRMNLGKVDSIIAGVFRLLHVGDQ